MHLNLWAIKNHDPPPTSSADIEYACLAAPCHPWHRCTSPSLDVASVPLIANEENLSNLKSTWKGASVVPVGWTTRKVKAQEISYEELPQLSFDEFSDDYVMPMPFEDEYSQWIPYEDWFSRLNIPTTYVIAGYGDFSRQESEFLIVYLLMPRFGIRICRSVPSDAMIKLDFT